MPRSQPHHISRAVPSPTPEPGRRTTAKNVIQNTLVALEKMVDSLPILSLKPASRDILDIIGIAVKAKQNTDDLFELLIQLRRMESVVITPLLNRQHLGSPTLQTRLDRLVIELIQLAKDWEMLKAPRNSIFSLINHNYGAAIADVSKRIRLSIDAFESGSQISATIVTESTQRAIERMERHLISKAVQDLPRAAASFDSISRNNAPVCFEGTRVTVLDDILCWIASDGHRIYILNGIAGVGKTTIAQTVAILAAKHCCLSASFFFSRADANRSSSRLFFPTLAFQLAQFSAEFEVRISEALMQCPDAPTKTPREQLNKLIVEPLHNVSIMHGQSILIVLDALD